MIRRYWFNKPIVIYEVVEVNRLLGTVFLYDLEVPLRCIESIEEEPPALWMERDDGWNQRI